MARAMVHRPWPEPWFIDTAHGSTTSKLGILSPGPYPGYSYEDCNPTAAKRPTGAPSAPVRNAVFARHISEVGQSAGRNSYPDFQPEAEISPRKMKSHPEKYPGSETFAPKSRASPWSLLEFCDLVAAGAAVHNLQSQFRENGAAETMKVRDFGQELLEF
eukprot:3669377-Rhodomonas_salina.1